MKKKKKKLKTGAVGAAAAAVVVVVVDDIYSSLRFPVSSYTFWNQQGIFLMGPKWLVLGLEGYIAHSPNAKPEAERKWEIHTVWGNV